MIKELINNLIKKQESEWQIVTSVEVDWCFLIFKWLKYIWKKTKDKDWHYLVATLKHWSDSRSEYAPTGGKINLCEKTEEYEWERKKRNYRHRKKYWSWLYWKWDDTYLPYYDIGKMEQESENRVIDKMR